MTELLSVRDLSVTFASEDGPMHAVARPPFGPRPRAVTRTVGQPGARGRRPGRHVGLEGPVIL